MHAAILMHDAADEQLGFLAHRQPQIVVEIGEHGNRRRPGLQRTQVQPLPGEIDHQPVRLRVRQHPPHLLLQHRRFVQFVLGRYVDQLVVGNAAPQEERQARRQLQIADAITFCPDARFSGSASLRNTNSGSANIALQRALDAGIEIPVVAALLVKRHQRFGILRRHRTAERVPCQRIDDLLRARRLFGRIRRPAHKNLLHAGRFIGARRLERPQNLDLAHVRIRT